MSHDPSPTELIQQSSRIISQERWVLTMPVLGALGATFIIILFLMPILFFNPEMPAEMVTFLRSVKEQGHFLSKHERQIFYFKQLGLFIWGHKPLLLALISIHFYSTFCLMFVNSCIVAAAAMRLEGKDPEFKDALTVAILRIPQLLVWSLFVSSAGILLNMKYRRSESGRSLGSALFGIGWHAVNLLVIPIIVLHGTNPLTAAIRSAGLLRETSMTEAIGALLHGWRYEIPIVIIYCMAMCVLVSPLSIAVRAVLGGLLLALGIYLVLRINVSKVIYRTALYYHLQIEG